MRPSAYFLAFVLLALACGGCGKRRQTSSNPLLITPTLAVEALPGKVIYYNGPALSWLQQKRPELLTTEEQQPMAPRSKAFFQAAQNPKLFRQLDRQLRFDALLLSGDPSQYRPLLEHLLDTGDWKLAYLDHTSLIFQRGDFPKWEPTRLGEVQAKLPHLNSAENALWHALAASKLVATRQYLVAKQWLEAAQKQDDALPEVWTTWGQYHLATGDYKQAQTAADQALKLDETSQAALAVKTQALYATKRFTEAFQLSYQLVQERSEDPNILFYHAKISHEARQFPEEIKAMQKLIKLANAAGVRVDPGYRVYLAQAYAADGQADPALMEFALALQDPELPAEQRQFAEDTRKLILQKTGGK